MRREYPAKPAQSRQPLLWLAMFFAVAVTLAATTASAQTFSGPNVNARFGSNISLDSIETVHIDSNIFLINGQHPGSASPLQTPSGSVSKLDLRAPGRARHEFEKGYELLMKKDLDPAIAHLTKSISLYPSFVAAHNALGTAYLTQGRQELARDQFASAIALDDHLPNSYLNLSCAQLALHQNAAAEDSLKKATAIAPLDLQLLTALAYAEFANRDYPAVIATVRHVHEGKHQGAALVHYFAAASYEAQDHIPDAQQELRTLLREDPKSPNAEQYRQIIDKLNIDEITRASFKRQRLAARADQFAAQKQQELSNANAAAETLALQAQQSAQIRKEEIQIAEAEAEPNPTCLACPAPSPTASSIPIAATNAPVSDQPLTHFSTPVIRIATNEVAIFFAATDHGKSITNLTPSDIAIRDSRQPPESIVAFRNESQLPLRLGLIIDTSNSVTGRFHFEQAAAAKFLQTVLTNEHDLAFVVGVNNSVLVAQDFTADPSLASAAIEKLAPGGGTALWDAVNFAAAKLAAHPETQPVARILVLISDGQDNSSSATLKQAIAQAQQAEVAVYTVTTSALADKDPAAQTGDHALKTLAELTGGSAFTPGSIHHLNSSLTDLQQVIRGRYLVSYKPAAFQLNSQYRPIEIQAQKGGHKLTIYTRKGYYTSPTPAIPANE